MAVDVTKNATLRLVNADQLDLIESLSPEDLPAVLESLLFVATEPVELATLARSLGVRLSQVESAAGELAARLKCRGLRLQRSVDRFQLVTAPECSRHVERFLGVVAEQPLSRAALETLAIVAYRQPVTRATIEMIRGVNAERALATLRSRSLVEEVGRAEAIGRPVLFGTTIQFLEHFGLESLADLPPFPEEAEHDGWNLPDRTAPSGESIPQREAPDRKVADRAPA